MSDDVRPSQPATPPEGEFGLIAWIRERARKGSRATLGIGDDCASLVFTPGAEVLVSTDMLMDGRHFELARTSAAAVGYKALAVNLSDIAAMAGEPVAAVVAVALPRDRSVEVAQGLLSGMLPLAERFGLGVVGGDTNAWDGPLVICVTILGEAKPPGPVRRSGARPDDVVLVTGPLGGSLLGRHLRPEPRISEARALRAAAEVRAMIDISDGLASDLGHILEESGNLGALLDGPAIPIHPDAIAMSQDDGRPPLDHALNDGEDFELCLVVPPPDAERLLAGPPPGVALFRVGEITATPGLRLRRGDGQVVPLRPGGFDHLTAVKLPGSTSPLLEIEATAQGVTIGSESEEDTDRIGRALADIVEPGSVIGLVGPLGAGKTRLVRAIAEALGVEPGAIASPTFVLIHEYQGRMPIYHFDIYRLQDAEEFEALGPDDYWDGEGVCLIEWADRIADRLPPGAWTIRIVPEGPTRRLFELDLPPGSVAAERLQERLRTVRQPGV
jgi:thiamine-monophosphate kinase